MNKKLSGFTLIELVVVIVILGVLAATAFPKFINLASDARISVITQLKVSTKSANDLLFLKSKMSSYSTQPVPNRADLIDVDLNNDGIFDINGSIDVRLKWGYLDNTDIAKRIDFSDEFSLTEEGIEHTYVGYDLNKNSNVKDDNCYFSYTQASDADTPPVYEIIDSGC
ncbi:MAG: prepilin-type N-terminal cleavage/methylation domain-containing protein [Thalassotalea sp.]